MYSHQLTVHTEGQEGVRAELTRNREAAIIKDVEPSKRLSSANPPMNCSIHVSKYREFYGVGGQVCCHELYSRRRAVVAEEALAPGQELARGTMVADPVVAVKVVVGEVFELEFAGHNEE